MRIGFRLFTKAILLDDTQNKARALSRAFFFND